MKNLMGYQVWLNGYEDSYSESLFMGDNCFGFGGRSCSVDTCRRGTKMHYLRGKNSIVKAEYALERFFADANCSDMKDRIPRWFNHNNHGDDHNWLMKILK